jgi:hypothetical protein
LEYSRLKLANEEVWMHPILPALLFVMEKDRDFREIVRHHPINKMCEFYRDDPKWEEDISGLLPEANRWWEGLGALQSKLSLLFFLTFCFFDSG